MNQRLIGVYVHFIFKTFKKVYKIDLFVTNEVIILLHFNVI
jgi:hypothetical protein